MLTSRPSARRAFTLVEMLVVLGIIGLLVALLIPAIIAAINNARRTAMSLEIANLANALETYKQQRGEYPPSFGDYNSSGTLVYSVTSGTPSRYTSAVEKHFQRCYPKFIDNPSSTTDPKDRFYTEIAPKIDQGEALVLWLRSVSSNPARPLDTTDTTSTRLGFYEFDEKRLVDADGDGFATYQPRFARETDYIYMENRNYAQFMQQNCYARSGANQSTLPYGSNATTPVNPKTFQIICAGLDGDFGALTTVSSNRYLAKQFPAGVEYRPGDRDNLTNFSEGKTLGDARPQ